MPKAQLSAEQPTTKETQTYQDRAAAAAAKSLQSCPTLCDPIDGSPPGFPVPGIRQARTLEWVAIPLMRKRRNHKEMARRSKLACACCPLNCVGLVVIPWTAARQAPLSMGFSRQEYESGLPFPPLGELPDPGIQPVSPA